jgi:cell division protein FtsB
LVLIADALVGENGWFERQREQVRLEEMTGTLDRVRRENADLDVRVKRLDAADPAAIEDLARRKLEMLKPGEVLFIAATPPGAADARDTSLPTTAR